MRDPRPFFLSPNVLRLIFGFPLAFEPINLKLPHVNFETMVFSLFTFVSRSFAFFSNVG